MSRPVSVVLDVVRGGLIGLAELVPGISGGTVALIVGIYERALHNGSLLLDLAKERTREAARRVDWAFLAAVGVGMLTAVFTMSSVLHGFVEGHPQVARGLFLGMVAVSLLVPVGMMDRRHVRRRLPLLVVLFLLGAAAAFFGTGVTSAPREDPSLVVLFFAGMIAVCALVLPGLSGSFLLLAFGLYQPVMGSLSAREWPVIITFALGALLGLVLFVRVLDHLMSRHRTVTLTVMAGLMAGSLRALWPWQDDDAALLAPSGNIGPVLVAVAVGAAVVAALLVTDHVLESRGSKVVTQKEPEA